ncbi:MAG: ATP phosphoribosyltransferase regulatory subunit, partial [Dehalococcoidia bacterium]
GVGDETDIVQKEMYSFEDHGGDGITLRPEGTASVCRAYIENGLHNSPQPVRMFYMAPMFRYERPQAGRFRQHHQFGCEAIGDQSPKVDAEIIELGWKYIADLGIK